MQKKKKHRWTSATRNDEKLYTNLSLSAFEKNGIFRKIMQVIWIKYYIY